MVFKGKMYCGTVVIINILYRWDVAIVGLALAGNPAVVKETVDVVPVGATE